MKENEQESQSFPDWDVVYYSDDNIVIVHRSANSTHAVVPPHSARRQSSLDWNPQRSVRWLTSHWRFKNNINCSCGHWVKIPPATLELFIATVKIVEATKC